MVVLQDLEKDVLEIQIFQNDVAQACATWHLLYTCTPYTALVHAHFVAFITKVTFLIHVNLVYHSYQSHSGFSSTDPKLKIM